MKNSKKIMAVSMATAMTLGSMSTVFALDVDGTPYSGTQVGDKYYSLQYIANYPDQFEAAIQGQMDNIILDINGNSAKLMDFVTSGADDFDIWAADPANQTAVDPTILVEADGTETSLSKDLAVEGVSAVNAKTLAVTFGKEITAEEQAKLTFTVKKDGTAIPFKVSAYEGAVAKIVKTNELALDKGSYEVTVAGLAEGANNVATTAVTAQIATTLDVASTSILDETAKSKVAVELKDQYGDAMELSTAAFTYTAYNVTQSTDATSKISFDTTDKYFYINSSTTSDFKVDDKVNVTFVHKATGLTVTKELTVVQGALVSEMAFGEVVLPTGKTTLTSDLKDVMVKYTAADQYGTAVELTSSDVSIVISDTAVLSASDITFTKDTDKNTVIKIAKFLKEGDVKVTLVSKTTGASTAVDLAVQQAPGTVFSMQLAEATKTIAANSTAKVGMTVSDNYGTVIEPKNYADNTKYNIVSSNPSVVANDAALKIFDTSSDADYGKLQVKVVSGATKDATTTLTISDKTTGKQYASMVVTAGEVAAPTTIDLATNSEHSTTLVKGATTATKYEVKDQYGNKWETNSANYSVEYAIKDSAEAITETGSADVDESAASAAVAAAKEGTAVLQAKLYYKKGTADEKLVDTEETTFTVVANTSTGLTYSVADIPTLYKDANVDADAETATGADAGEIDTAVEAGYAKEFKVMATDASGTTYEIPTSAIVSITPDNADVVVKAGSTNTGYYVVTDSVAITDEKDVTANITVVLNADDTVKTITKAVTVSKDERVAQSVAFKDVAANVTNAAASTTKDVEEYTIAKASEYVSADQSGTQDVYVWVEDQFGGYGLSSSATVNIAPVSGITATTDDTISIASGAVNVADVSTDTVFTKDGAKFRIIATSGAQADFVTVTMTDGVFPTKAATADFAVDGTDNKIATVKFSEKVKVSALAAGDFSVTGGSVAVGDAPTLSAVDADADGYATTFTFTCAGTNASGFDSGSQLKVDATKVEDKAGNKAAAGTIDFTAVP